MKTNLDSDSVHLVRSKASTATAPPTGAASSSTTPTRSRTCSVMSSSATASYPSPSRTSCSVTPHSTRPRGTIPARRWWNTRSRSGPGRTSWTRSHWRRWPATHWTFRRPTTKASSPSTDWSRRRIEVPKQFQPTPVHINLSRLGHCYDMSRILPMKKAYPCPTLLVERAPHRTQRW